LIGCGLRFREPVFPGDTLGAAFAEDGSIEITDAAGRLKATAVLKQESE
jgi:acyl dehydratase